MNKTKIMLLFMAFVMTFYSIIFAQSDETITITTYYPSPYGAYNELEVHRGVTYKPLDQLPTTDLKEGELVYVDNNPSDNTKGEFYYRGGGNWQQFGGGGTSFTYYCYNNSSYGNPLCQDAGGVQGHCPTGYKERLDLGNWGWCGCWFGWVFYFRPPGATCGANFRCDAPAYGGAAGTWNVGQAYVCSQ